MKKTTIKRLALLTILSTISASFAGLNPVSAAAITATSITGAGITANSAALNTAVTPTINYTTTTALTVDGQVISFNLNGLSVAAGQTLDVADLTLAGVTLEAAPGTPDNGAAEVSITNGAAGNDNPLVIITLDNSVGPVAPSYTAGAKTLVVAAAQLVSHDTTAGNYAILVATSLDNGGFFFYVADENDVQIQATVDNVLSFVIRNTADTADQPNVGSAAIGPNLCDLGNLNVAGVQTCSYRLKVSTNAVNGYYVTVSLDGDLNNGPEFLNNTATGAAPVGGTEGYNVLLTAGTATVGAVVECPGTATGDCTATGVDFSNATGTTYGTSADADYTTGVTVYDVNGPNNPIATDTANTALVVHSAEADSGTAAGLYTQLATYTVTANW